MALLDLAERVGGLAAGRSRASQLRSQAAFHVDLLAKLPGDLPIEPSVREHLNGLCEELVELERSRAENRIWWQLTAWPAVLTVASTCAAIALAQAGSGWWRFGAFLCGLVALIGTMWCFFGWTLAILLLRAQMQHAMQTVQSPEFQAALKDEIEEVMGPVESREHDAETPVL